MAQIKATVYHKPCLTCRFDDWHLVEAWAENSGVELRTRRTEYNPLWHQLATKSWGNEMYPPFIEFKNKNIAVSEIITKIKAKEEDDLQNLLRAKKRSRKNRKVVENQETDKTIEKEANEKD